MLPKSALAASDTEAWSAGVDLAIELFHEADPDECVLSTDEYRDGRPQYNIVLRYLRRLQGMSDPRIEESFAAVLSDYTSGCCDGAVADPDCYERFRQPVTTTETPVAEASYSQLDELDNRIRYLVDGIAHWRAGLEASRLLGDAVASLSRAATALERVQELQGGVA